MSVLNKLINFNHLFISAFNYLIFAADNKKIKFRCRCVSTHFWLWRSHKFDWLQYAKIAEQSILFHIKNMQKSRCFSMQKIIRKVGVFRCKNTQKSLRFSKLKILRSVVVFATQKVVKADDLQMRGRGFNLCQRKCNVRKAISSKKEICMGHTNIFFTNYFRTIFRSNFRSNLQQTFDQTFEISNKHFSMQISIAAMLKRRSLAKVNVH